MTTTLEILNRMVSRLGSITGSPKSLADTEEYIRKAFSKAGQDIPENSITDRRIKQGKSESHLLNAEMGRQNLDKAAKAGVLTPGDIQMHFDEFCEHYKNVTHCPVDHSYLSAFKEAHADSTKAKLKRMEETFVGSWSAEIVDIAIEICQHCEAIQRPILVETKRYNRLLNAASRMCRISSLGDKATNWVNDQIQTRFQERDSFEALLRAEFIPPPDYESYPHRRKRQGEDLKLLFKKAAFHPPRPFRRKYGTWRRINSHKKILLWRHLVH